MHLEQRSGVGGRLRLIRESKELSLQALTDLSGISKAYLVRIEKEGSEPNLGLVTVERLAHALGVAPAWLAFGRAVEDDDRVVKLAGALNAEPGLRIDYLKAIGVADEEADSHT
jgi:transcriptional regulator with XRE-family HTH domain